MNGRRLQRRVLDVALSTASRLREVPRGTSLRYDLASSLPNFRPSIVFDVGAHIGESAAEYAVALPSANIYCFEPNGAAFEQLNARFADEARVHCHNVALADASAVETLYVRRLSYNSSLAPSAAAPRAEEEVVGEQQVQVATVDEFCEEHLIDHISLLKIDTEGGDLEVLVGAERMLREQRVGLINTEVAVNPHNDKHVPLERVQSHLAARNYWVFGFYGQTPEFTTGQPYLRRCDAVFLSDRLSGPTGGE